MREGGRRRGRAPHRGGADLLPLLSQYLPDGEWAALTRAATTTLSGREQMLVLGLTLEDACALDRARLLAGLSPPPAPPGACSDGATSTPPSSGCGAPRRPPEVRYLPPVSEGPGEFAEQLRRFRERAALSQEELATRAGLTGKAVGALERGERRRPYPHTVRALADALGLDDDEREALTTAARPGGEAPAPTTRIPALSTPLTGREADLDEIVTLLRSGATRLLTLTGRHTGRHGLPAGVRGRAPWSERRRYPSPGPPDSARGGRSPGTCSSVVPRVRRLRPAPR